MAESNIHVDDLIARIIAGEASDKEKLLLEQWMDASDENKKYFGDIRYLHDKVMASHKIVHVNTESAWNNVQRQMQHGTIPLPSTGTRISVYFWMRVAAIFMLIFGLSFWLYNSYFVKNLHPIVVASQNNTLTFKLPDSSQIFLNRHSKIIYTNGYGKKQREVKLSGEAYFKVAHSKDKLFIVEAEGTLIKDLGTSFNIKAYSGDSIVEVFVESGEVAFFTKQNPGIVLSKGEKGTFEKATQIFRKFKTAELNILAYKNKVLIFQDASLSEVLEKLNSIYQTKVTVTNQALMGCKITVTFENENIDAIVGIISETLRLHLIKTNGGYILDGDNCYGH